MSTSLIGLLKFKTSQLESYVETGKETGHCTPISARDRYRKPRGALDAPAPRPTTQATTASSPNFNLSSIVPLLILSQLSSNFSSAQLSAVSADPADQRPGGPVARPEKREEHLLSESPTQSNCECSLCLFCGPWGSGMRSFLKSIIWQVFSSMRVNC